MSSDIALRSTIQKLQSELQRMKSRIDSLDSAVSRDGLTLKNPIIKDAVIDASTVAVSGDITGNTLDIGAGDATIDADGNWVCPYAEVADTVIDTGSVVTPVVEVTTVTLTNADTGDDQTITASGDEGDETITVLNNFTCIDGVFGATTVTIGDQVLSEADYLYVKDAATPGIIIQDTGDSIDAGATGLLYISDKNNQTLFSVHATDTGVTLYGHNLLTISAEDEIRLILKGEGMEQLAITDGVFRPYTDNDVDLGASDKTFKDSYFSGQQNYAGDTTYKIEADGDAYFKDLDCSGNAVIDGTTTLTGSVASDLTMASGKDIIIADDTAEVFKIRQGANAYLCITTTNGSEVLSIGCGGGLVASFSPSGVQLTGSGATITEFDTSALAASDTKVPTNTTVKEYADQMLKANDSTYTHVVSAPSAFRNDANSTSQIVCGSAGVYSTGTGVEYILCVLSPPEWLLKYASDNSKTVTATTLTVNWNDTNSTDYLTRLRIWHSDYNSTTVTALLDDATNYGSGTTGFRNDGYNFTDRAMVNGEWLTIYIEMQQGTAATCRLVSFETIYTVA